MDVTKFKELLASHGFGEFDEDGTAIASIDEHEVDINGNKVVTRFPDSKGNYYRLVFESYTHSVEESYYWILNHLKEDLGFTLQEKVIDTFTASEQSAFWGASAQRLSLQQQNAQNYLRTISEMLNGVYQLVREIRNIDINLSYYADVQKAIEEEKKLGRNKISKGLLDKRNDAEIVLKDKWVTQVEGGTKSPTSVLGLSQQVGFATLPDLFYKTHVNSKEDIGSRMDKLAKDFNPSVLRVLREKLREFFEWKEHTQKELEVRKNFQVKYLRQMFNSVRLYAQWARPYMKHANRLSSKDRMIEDPSLIAAFDGALIEIETLCMKKFSEKTANKDFYSVISVSVNHKTRPSLDYQRDQHQHRGPIHVGATEIVLRAYAWDDEQLQNYRDMRKEEDLALLAEIDTGIKDSLESLGDEMKTYLKEAGESFELTREEKKAETVSKKKKDSHKQHFFEPFYAPFAPIVMFYKRKSGEKTRLPSGKKETKHHKWLKKGVKDSALKTASGMMWHVYKNYKKSHRMLAW
ncbi:hypothetical protein GOV04_01555 [Candidatus Woesearchaeota archaeon]|nr:hypothetical protein [Candidatus Woesearchaeota archaeon]